MTANPLDLIEARAQAATNGPWEARHVTDDYGDWEYADITHTYRDDGIEWPNQILGTIDLDEADAVFIAAARTDVEKMAKALRAVEAVHVPETYEYPEDSPDCAGCHAECQYCEGDHPWPCPTITAIRAVLNG